MELVCYTESAELGDPFDYFIYLVVPPRRFGLPISRLIKYCVGFVLIIRFHLRHRINPISSANYARRNKAHFKMDDDPFFFKISF